MHLVHQRLAIQYPRSSSRLATLPSQKSPGTMACSQHFEPLRRTFQANQSTSKKTTKELPTKPTTVLQVQTPAEACTRWNQVPVWPSTQHGAGSYPGGRPRKCACRSAAHTGQDVVRNGEPRLAQLELVEIVLGLQQLAMGRRPVPAGSKQTDQRLETLLMQLSCKFHFWC